ncbi:Uu.00g007310.m01.CDS01 [Anthostomella pinea]|uniref:Uu.00g007310.m01.CDS01 n=1 Tax=Anthostomella pinea TaxID=933095 RepID=A0AAI8VWZ4_9PEZI|nr:Uu.00g007310.m01.CDS01 [Anthostomella pinea]
MAGSAASFDRFPDLPPELRIKIWKQHFNDNHGTQIHIFHSAPSGPSEGFHHGEAYPSCPQYIGLDAETNSAGCHVLGSAMASSEALAMFQEIFEIGNMECFRSNDGDVDHHLLYRLFRRHTDEHYSIFSGSPDQVLRSIFEAMLSEDLRRARTHFAMNRERDLIYIIDDEVSIILTKLCEAPWMHRAKRVAFLIRNFQTPPADRLSRWVKWHSLITNPPPNVRQLLEGPHIEEILLVVVPMITESQAREQQPDDYGFAEFRYGEVPLEMLTAEDQAVVENHSRSIAMRFQEYMPNLRGENKIRCVMDTAAMTCAYLMFDITSN